MQNKIDSKTKNILIGLGIATFIGVVYIYRITILKGINKVIDYTFSKAQEIHLSQLNSGVQNRFRNFIADIEKNLGYKVIITSSYRDFSKQLDLNKQNESNASAGFSTHNYGIALDINLIDKKGNIIKKSDTLDTWRRTGVVNLAKNKYGMRWGGDSFGTYHDPVHFDYGNLYDVSSLRNKAIKQFGSLEKSIGNQIKLT